VDYIGSTVDGTFTKYKGRVREAGAQSRPSIGVSVTEGRNVRMKTVGIPTNLGPPHWKTF